VTSETDFYQEAERWLYRLFELNPVAATQAGDHRWDNRLGEYAPEALESQHQEMLDALAGFNSMDTAGFSMDAEIDHTVVVQLLKSNLRRYERIKNHRRSPSHYLNQIMTGIFLLILKEFAPLPERLRSALGRLEAAPRLLEEARSNLMPAEVPPVWAELALEQAKRAPGLFTGLLPSIAAEAAPELQSDLSRAGEAAAQAMLAYSEFLKKAVLTQAAGDFAVGRDLFDEMLQENHMVDYDADGLLKTGWRLFHETEAQMKAVAHGIDPGRSIQTLLEEAKDDHPTAEGLLQAYEKAMQSARQCVIQNDIVTIPDGESLTVVETPLHLRPLMPYGGYIPPGILEEKQDGLFMVTPVDPDSPKTAQDEKLRGHNYIHLPVVALHEAYPGHHLQLVLANRHRSIPRRLATDLSSLFIEGWAFYCEELMEQIGYIAQPVQRLGRLKDQLWRAARIILDVSLHTKGMSVDEAADFLVEKCQIEPTNALAEVRRYTTSPTQPQSYLMGKLAILDLIKDYRAANPDRPLKEVHDTILACGSLTPRLMRKQLLGE
jgi:uncharacterized protein (DUF885 family)